MEDRLPGRDLRSIAVFMLRHIGDTLLSTPAFHALRAAFPTARILAVVNEWTQEMLEGNPDIDEILVFHRHRRKEGGFGRWKEEAALVRSLRAFGAELAVNLTEGDRGAILSVLSGARYRVGVTPNRKGFLGKEIVFTHLCGLHDRYRHAVLRDLDVVAAAGIPPADLRLRFSISDEDREKAVRILREAGIAAGLPFAVVQPTSRWTFKCWTEDGMAGVISHLADLGFAPVVTSGPAAEIRKIVGLDGGPAAWSVPRKTYIGEKWIRHAGWYPDRTVRLFEKAKGRYSASLVHERVIVDGEIGRCGGHLLHRSFEGVPDLFRKIPPYSEASARQMFEQGRRCGGPDLLLRPAFAFFKSYLWNLGLLDGWEGFAIGVSTFTAVFCKYAKLRELRMVERGEGTDGRG